MERVIRYLKEAEDFSCARYSSRPLPVPALISSPPARSLPSFYKDFFHILALCKKEIVPVHSQMGDWLKPLQWIDYFENQLTDGILLLALGTNLEESRQEKERVSESTRLS